VFSKYSETSSILKKMLDEHHTKTFEEKRSMNNVVTGWLLVKVLSVFPVSWVLLLLPSESKLASYLLIPRSL